MSVFDRIANWFKPATSPAQPRQQRVYSMAKNSRLTVGWGTQTNSEDAELAMSLRVGRARSRQLIRDAAYAKRAKVIVQNNIVGVGIGMQAQVRNTRDELFKRVNDDIEQAWEAWTRKSACHVGRTLHFPDFERVLMGQVFEAGEVFIRFYQQAVGNSAVPLAMEVIEAERIADELAPAGLPQSTSVRLGIEVDAFGGPLAYFIRSLHPGELRLDPDQTLKVEKVPASSILHLRIVERWPQTRAMPWLHAAARKLNDMDGLTEAEITAARAAACYMGFIEMPDALQQYGEVQEDGSVQSEIEPNIIERLNPGEKFNFAAPNRPNANLDSFMRMMLREVAAGAGTSYEGLSRDYSQSNYSSSRLALVDDRDMWRNLQHWFIRDFRQEVHRRWMQQAVLAGAIPSINVAEYAQNPAKFEAVRFKPRGWSWIDPTSEVEAYKEAVLAGFTTVSDVISLTGSGRDIEDIVEERKQELALMKAAGLVTSTDPATVEIPPIPLTPEQQLESKQPAAPAPQQEKPQPEPARAVAQRLLWNFKETTEGLSTKE